MKLDLLSRLHALFGGSKHDRGILRAAGGDAEGLSRMHLKVALAWFLLFLVAPPLLVFVNYWLGWAVVLSSVSLYISAICSPVYRRILTARDRKKDK